METEMQEDTRSHEETVETSDSSVSPDRQDGGPGSHTEQGTGGSRNDTASGGIPEEADQRSEADTASVETD